jgi:hypothetical protein
MIYFLVRVTLISAFLCPISCVAYLVLALTKWLSKRMAYHRAEACFETSAQKIMYACLAINTSSPDVNVRSFQKF